VDDRGIQSQVKIWDTQTGRELRSIVVPSTNPGSPSSTRGLFFSPDGRELAVIPFIGNTLTLWDAATGQQLRAFGNAAAQAGPYDTSAAALNHVNAVAFSPDGHLLAAGGLEMETSGFDPR